MPWIAVDGANDRLSARKSGEVSGLSPHRLPAGPRRRLVQHLHSRLVFRTARTNFSRTRNFWMRFGSGWRNTTRSIGWSTAGRCRRNPTVASERLRHLHLHIYRRRRRRRSGELVGRILNKFTVACSRSFVDRGFSFGFAGRRSGNSRCATNFRLSPSTISLPSAWQSRAPDSAPTGTVTSCKGDRCRGRR